MGGRRLSPSPFQEKEVSENIYPTWLYKDGIVGEDARLVNDAEQEAAARKDGYIDHTEYKPAKQAKSKGA